MNMPVIISNLNHKGGVLKTTITVNLSAALAKLGKKVLVIDADLQQNLTSWLIGPLEYEDGMFTLYEAMMAEVGLERLIRKTSTPNLDIVPVCEDFLDIDINLVSKLGREAILKDCIEKTEGIENYDLVFIDNPPSVSLTVMNSLVASDYYIVPCTAEYLSMQGLSLLGRSIANINKINEKLTLLGVIVTKYHPKERICNQVVSSLRERLGEYLFESMVRVNTQAKSAPSVQKTMFEFENSEKGRSTQDFTAMAKEFLERLEQAENTNIEEQSSESRAVNG
jgi:chromosome partitioning protein